MNFIDTMEKYESKVELKYCERCGGLWLRPQGSAAVHCAGCRAYLSARPDPGEAPPRKLKVRRKRQGQGADIVRDDCRFPNLVGYLEGVATTEVRV